jgi:hypothetical protein
MRKRREARDEREKWVGGGGSATTFIVITRVERNLKIVTALKGFRDCPRAILLTVG